MKKVCAFHCVEKGCQMESTIRKWGRNWNSQRRLTLLRSAYSFQREGIIKKAYDAIKWKEKFKDISDDWFNQFECRFDTIVYRLGWVNSIQEARQLISHEKLMINSKIVSWKGYQLKPSDVISIRDEKTKKRIGKTVEKRFQFLEGIPVEKRLNWYVPDYLYVNYNLLNSIFLYVPERHEIPLVCQDREEILLAMESYKYK